MASTLKKAADMAKKVLTKTPVAAKNALTKTPASGKGALEKTPVAGKGDLTKEPPTKLPYSQQALEAFKQVFSSYLASAIPFRFTEFPYYVEREWWKRTHRMTFWATWRQLRDVKRRELLAELGPERMRLKAIKFNTVLPQALRDECADKLSNMPKYSHPALILNM